MNKQSSPSISNNREALLLDAEELGIRLGFTSQQIWRLHRQGKIPVITLGHRTHRYSLPSVMEALQALEQAAVLTLKKPLSRGQWS